MPKSVTYILPTEPHIFNWFWGVGKGSSGFEVKVRSHAIDTQQQKTGF